jgi:hypothetical protein
MSVETTRPAVRINDAWSAPSRALRLEKARSSSRMHGEQGSQGQTFDRRGPQPTRRGQSHYGTVDDVSSWHGPRLTTPFAAQVIAQATTLEVRKAPSAAIAYRARVAQTVRAHLLDDAV